MAAGMATGKCWFKIPEAIKFDLRGKLAPHVSGKDVILHIIGMIGVDGALYKSMEFSGIGLQSLSMDDRLCMANMAIEAGAKNGIFAFDEITEAYVKDRVNRPYVTYEADADAVLQCLSSGFEPDHPYRSLPAPAGNTRTMDEIKEPVRIDQVVIGSCTNGRLSIWQRLHRF